MAAKKTIITKDQIVSIYMNYVLEHSEKPKSVCHFAKINDFTETEFYAFFGTIESVEKEIFKLFADKTVELFSKNKDYETYDMKSKMLRFYFTFFEILTANRSYVVLVLKNQGDQLNKLRQLSGLRNSFRNHFKIPAL